MFDKAHIAAYANGRTNIAYSVTFEEISLACKGTDKADARCMFSNTSSLCRLKYNLLESSWLS